MVPEVIVLALLVGMIAKGKVSRLADVKIKYIWLIFVVFAISFGTRELAMHNFFGFLSAPRSVVKIGSFIVLILLAIANLRITGVKLMLAGLVANLAAITLNGGMMPVLPKGLEMISGMHLSELLAKYPFMKEMLIGPNTKLAFLCDMFPLCRPYVVTSGVYSIGDFITTIGGFIAIVVIMRTPLPSEKKPAVEEA